MSNSESLFSILIASYNNGRFIQDAFNSIYEQSYTNWEVIIVDDGSTDDSVELIKKASANNARIKLFQNDKKPLILFSPVPPVGRFPAIPNPLRFAFGFWEFLLQASLAHVINSMDNAYLLDERFPDGTEYYLEDGIHPSPLAYDPWSEKLAIMTVELLNQKKIENR